VAGGVPAGAATSALALGAAEAVLLGLRGLSAEEEAAVAAELGRLERGLAEGVCVCLCVCVCVCVCVCGERGVEAWRKRS